MIPPAKAYSSNLLIQAMALDDLDLLKPHFERVQISEGQVLAAANQPIEHIYFPEGGIVSLTATTSKYKNIEVGILGQEGMTGIAALLGSNCSPLNIFVRIYDTSALRISFEEFIKLITRCESLHSLLLRYAEVFLVQSAFNTLANAQHKMWMRLARSLLMCHDRVVGDEISVTHETLARMITAQRTGVTVRLHLLEGAGLIRSKRARVVIRKRDKLEDLAGDAYGVPEAEYRRLIGPFGKSANA